MDSEAVAARIESTCRELGLSRSIIDTIVTQVPRTEPESADVQALAEENQRLRAELQRVRGEKARLAEKQREMMQLLGTQSPDKLMHDLRNKLNELTLLHAINEDS